MDSLTQRYTAHVRQVTAAYVTTAARWSSEFSDYHDSLDLAGILDPDVLLSGAARMVARHKIDCVARALEQHKMRYGNFMGNYQRDVLDCASALPEADKAAIREPLAASLQDQLHEQTYFYRLRERWITAVRGLIAIFDTPESRIRFDGELFLFDDDDEREHFIALLTEIDEVAAMEEILMEARMMRMEERAGVLGLRIE